MNIIRLQGDTEKRKGVYYEYDADMPPLGEGGMGRVFKGYRVVERTGERMPVAIKAIYENIPDPVIERARRESRIQLDNDNLIHMYGFVESYVKVDGDTKARVYYHVIMELLIGVTLENLLNGITTDQNGMQIPFAQEIREQYLKDRNSCVKKIMMPVLSGLMALHDRGYIHRDIDPSNIMITIDRKIKLIDFGICKRIVSLESMDKSLTSTGSFIGKVNYAAPELVLGDIKNQNYTTDIYALGVLMFQLSTGHLPFIGTDQDILSAHLHKALPLKEIETREFRRIIRKATDKSQQKRYATVAEFRVDLERTSLTRHDSGSGKVKVIAGLSSVAVLAGLALFLFRPEDKAEYAADETSLPTAEEIYTEALSLLERKDSLLLHLAGKEKLRVLAEDSLYVPAARKYYLIQINSSDSAEVRSGYAGLLKMAKTYNDHDAIFECGLTLSKGNRFFDIPSVRQSYLDLEPDLDKANEWLYEAMNSDTTDYKSVYWAFNNLMEKKISGSLPLSGDKQILSLYKLFGRRISDRNDPIADLYRKAIQSDGETLRAWGLIE